MANIELPVIIPNRLLISPGIWNDNEYSAEELSNAFSRTEWTNKEKVSLFLNHNDKDAGAFVGYVKNPSLKLGKIYGDLEIWDEKTAVILTQAKAKFGISAKIKGEESENGKMLNFSFENWSVVTTPACSTAYINLSKDDKKISIQYLISKDTFDSIEEIKSEEKMESEMDEELAKITGMETERKKRGMSPGEFYAVPRNPPSESALPIFDKAHTQNAMARFNQTDLSPAEKASAKRKIIAAANKFGIKVSDDFKSLSDIDERGLKMAEEKLNVVEEKKEEVLPVATELSEKDLLKELNNKFDKLIEVLSKKNLKEDEPEEEEEKESEEDIELKENKELIEVKKELAEIKKKLETPKSKTVTLSSNNVGSDAKYSVNDFANFLSSVDKPVKFN